MTKGRLFRLTVPLLLLLGAGSALSQVSTNYDLGWHVISGGGGTRTSASYQVGDSVGQWPGNGSASPAYRVDPGFWFGVSVPGGPWPTATPTVIPSATPTATPTPSPSVTPSATPTATPSPTPTTTPTQPAQPTGHVYLPMVTRPVTYLLPDGHSVRFRGRSRGVNMLGTVVTSERRTSLTSLSGDVVYPVGVFLVAVMDVQNMGLESDSVGIDGSFRVKDTAGRLFDMAPLNAQAAAHDEFGLPGVNETIQPGMTRRLVFAFDVLLESLNPVLDSLSPW